MLFSFVGGRGHLEPLLPVARAAAAGGHTVAVACAPSMLPTVEAEGLDAVPIGTSTGTTPARRPLRPVDRAREARDLRERFARRAAHHRAPLAVALCQTWRPDLVVCDETDFGVLVAAEHLELPYATVLVIAAGAFVRPDVVGPPLEELRARYGLPPDPELGRPSHYLVIATLPPSYRAPTDPLPDTAHCFRPGGARRTAPPPAWSKVRPNAATVYFTLGTIFHLESGDLPGRVLTGLQELPINVVATVGHDVDPAELGPRPRHVHIARYLPQASVLPHCDLVVSHGGSGSVIGALTYGLPSVLIPLGADQPQNAARCADLGVAQVLDAMSLTPESVRAAVAGGLEEPGYRRQAERLRDEIAALPPLSEALPLLERLAVEKRPQGRDPRLSPRSW
jgi:UDP:flavonoid glycosyltransferase YjiC (YdhE family)